MALPLPALFGLVSGLASLTSRYNAYKQGRINRKSTRLQTQQTLDDLQSSRRQGEASLLGQGSIVSTSATNVLNQRINDATNLVARAGKEAQRGGTRSALGLAATAATLGIASFENRLALGDEFLGVKKGIKSAVPSIFAKLFGKKQTKSSATGFAAFAEGVSQALAGNPYRQDKSKSGFVAEGVKQGIAGLSSQVYRKDKTKRGFGAQGVANVFNHILR